MTDDRCNANNIEAESDISGFDESSPGSESEGAFTRQRFQLKKKTFYAFWSFIYTSMLFWRSEKTNFRKQVSIFFFFNKVTLLTGLTGFHKKTCPTATQNEPKMGSLIKNRVPGRYNTRFLAGSPW